MFEGNHLLANTCKDFIQKFIIYFEGWERNRFKCFLTYIHLDFFRFQPSKCFVISTETADIVNVAHGKQAEQSSIFNGHIATRGVDGNTNQDFSSYTCFETSNSTGTSNWWYVDLVNTYILTEVKMFNRLDCCCKLFVYFMPISTIFSYFNGTFHLTGFAW